MSMSSSNTPVSTSPLDDTMTGERPDPTQVVADTSQLSSDFEESDVMLEPFSPSLLEELSPSSMLEGTCGVYLLKNKKGEDIGVFKPMDEEYVPGELSTALVKGGGSYRERAAFLVSHELGGYTGVPNTQLVTLKHPTFAGGEKTGSLQRFVPASTDMSDHGPAGIPVDEVHKIGIVDLLLFNVDRHEGNVLMRTRNNGSGTRELVPIDHGLCLPVIVTRDAGPSRSMMQDLYFAWQSWPQARQPFGPKATRFLSALSPTTVTRVVEVLKSDLGNGAIPSPALTTLKVGALLLRICLEYGKTLAAIADFVRQFLSDVLEEAWLHASAANESDTVSGQDVESPCSTAVVVRDEGQQDAALDVEEQLYERWEQRLLAALTVLLTRRLNLDAVPAVKSGAEGLAPIVTVDAPDKQTSPIERLDSPTAVSPPASDGDPKFLLEETLSGEDLFGAKKPLRSGEASVGVGAVARPAQLSCREEMSFEVEAGEHVVGCSAAGVTGQGR